MLGFHQKRKFKQFLYSPLTFVPLTLIVFLLGSSVWGVYTKEREARAKRDKQVAELEELQNRAAVLEAEIQRLSTDRGREEEIRGKFEVAREGERVVVIVDGEEEEQVIPEADLSFFRRVLNWFKRD